MASIATGLKRSEEASIDPYSSGRVSSCTTSHSLSPESVSDRLNLYEHFLGSRIAEGLADRTALLTADGALTYGEVDARAGQYANLLVEAGLRPEERVLIAMPDGLDFVAALFGIIRAGGVVVMINPQLKPNQIRYFYEYTRARVALVHDEVADTFQAVLAEADHRPDFIRVGTPDFTATLTAHSDAHPTFPSHEDDAAIWIFSGGTTGHPKAAVQSHRSFVNTTELYGHGVLGITPDDVTLSVPKLFFGYAMGINLFFPFSVGATAVLFPERCTAETLFAKIEAFKPTILANVPTMVNHLLGHPDAPNQDLSSIRLVTSAGEALPAELHRRWNALCGVPLLDGLGTAEMWHIFISNRPGDVKPGTLGQVVPGFQVEVRGEDGEVLGPDEVGYLWVKGDSRASGYWQQREKTRQAFVGDWYVSGDMISMDADGYVTYCGRTDDMLKVSGKWMSPGELENCLLEHEAVQEVAVVGVRSTDGLIKPEAFAVVATGHTPDGALAQVLQEWARTRLEPYKYPREVTFMDDLPRTHLGKVDRGELSREAAQS